MAIVVDNHLICMSKLNLSIDVNHHSIIFVSQHWILNHTIMTRRNCDHFIRAKNDLQKYVENSFILEMLCNKAQWLNPYYTELLIEKINVICVFLTLQTKS